ncbi:MAG: hypothetical protein NTY01_07385 [Verrucomicrobia bacterium]|nr:hypothetical protein [Verrucomicrobiota bacterium]
MKETKKLEWLIECLVHVIGRVAVPLEEVRGIVGNGGKQIRAYNLCDGTLTLTELAKKTGTDLGNLSHSIDRWVKNGIMFRNEEGNEVRFLHIYPIPANSGAAPKNTK